MLEELEEKFTKFEVARILGARALQIAMDAPLLLKIPAEELEQINFNPIEIAKRELLAEVLPITINRPMPKKKEEKIRVLTKEQVEDLKKKEAEEKVKKEEKAEKEIEEKTGKEPPIHAEEIKEDEKAASEEEAEEKKVTEDDEIMELAKPEDEAEGEVEEADGEE